MFNQKEYNKKWKIENKRHIKEYNNKYMRIWKAKNREYVNMKERERRKRPEVKLQMQETQREYFKKYPWMKWNAGRYRNNTRKDRLNIKNFLKKEDYKYLWFRDKAYLLKRPSLDRINPLKNYTLKNCRFIELSENSKRIRYIIIHCCPKCGYRKKEFDKSYPKEFLKTVNDKCKGGLE